MEAIMLIPIILVLSVLKSFRGEGCSWLDIM